VAANPFHSVRFSPLLDELISALTVLPGVGNRSAQRMAFHLLQRDKSGAAHLAQMLENALTNMRHCEQCRTLCETPLCQLCNNPRRDATCLCIVESPADIIALEQSASFAGRYFVLMGHLSPLDGIGPDAIGIPLLEQQMSQASLEEIIIATNPTVEGEATAHYIATIAKKHKIRTTRIAHGVPMGGELEYLDSSTLAHALDARAELIA